MGINDPDCSPFEIHGLDPAQTPILFLEIVSDDFPNASSCRTYADEKFGQETLQMQAFRLHYLTFAASSRLMATAQASPPHAATSTCRSTPKASPPHSATSTCRLSLRPNQVLYPMFPPVSDLVLRPTLG